MGSSIQMLKAACVLLLLSVAANACSLAVGAVDNTSERVNTAMQVYAAGLIVVAAHVGVFVFRAIRRERKSKVVFWTTIGLSVFAVPIAFLAIMMSGGMACGFGAIEYASYLLIFEIVGLVAQFVAWRIPPRQRGLTELHLEDPPQAADSHAL